MKSLIIWIRISVTEIWILFSSPKVRVYRYKETGRSKFLYRATIYLKKANFAVSLWRACQCRLPTIVDSPIPRFHSFCRRGNPIAWYTRIAPWNCYSGFHVSWACPLHRPRIQLFHLLLHIKLRFTTSPFHPRRTPPNNPTNKAVEAENALDASQPVAIKNNWSLDTITMSSYRNHHSYATLQTVHQASIPIKIWLATRKRYTPLLGAPKIKRCISISCLKELLLTGFLETTSWMQQLVFCSSLYTYDNHTVANGFWVWGCWNKRCQAVADCSSLVSKLA